MNTEKKLKKYYDKGEFKKYRELMFESGKYYNLLNYVTDFEKTFEEVPFTDGDSIVLCHLAYANLGDFAGKKLKEIFPLVTDSMKVAPYFHDDCMKLIENLQNSSRMGDIVVLDARAKLTELTDENGCQFSVTLYDCGDFIYMACRGTDDHLVGWFEDIDLSYVQELYSHTLTTEALNDYGEKYDKPIVVGGHSKGGNMALFSSAFCKKEVRDRIIKVYDHDGPGLLGAVMAKEGMADILPRVDKTCPEMTVFGMILQGEEPKWRTLYSHAKGMMQHYAPNWQINKEDGTFVKAERLDIASDVTRAVCEDLFTAVSDEDKLRFRTFLFNCFVRAKINALDDFTFGGVMRLIGAMFHQKCKEQRFMWKMLFKVLGNISKHHKEVKKARKKPQN